MGISLGLVGLGSFGNCFAPLFKSHPLVDRIALCDQEPERLRFWADKPAFRDKFNPRDAFSEFDDILKSDLDALVIITQHWLHAPMSVRAMEAGKHVYCAVPLISVPDADEILGWCDKVVGTARRTGQLFMFGETTFYRPQAMYCRRRAAEGAFGDFVYAEGEYFHDVDHGLREVKSRRLGSRSGQEHARHLEEYARRGVTGGPMHYPTHSTGGPISVMKAHAVRATALPYAARIHRDHCGDDPSNETALFLMSNGAHMRICEYREIGHPGREIFRVYGNKGSFENDTWCDKKGVTPLTVDQMRDPLPPEVVRAFQDWKKLTAPDPSKVSAKELDDFLSGHGGSHPHLVHEFVDAVAHGRTPACTAWDAAHFTAAGAVAHKSALKGGAMLDVPNWGNPPAR
ncbi:MAG: Gfo/Idh/MocA family oxidoreductase [Planctomycetota bacterium]